jgi:cytochrome b561
MRDPVKRGVAPGPARYGAGAVTFHWTVAALIVFLGGLGLLFDDIPRGARPFWINVHVCVGLIYFAAVIARVLWRTTHKAPDLRLDIGEFSRRTSFAVHHLLYVLMLLIPVVGVMARVWHGRGFDYGVFQLDFGAASDPPSFI